MNNIHDYNDVNIISECNLLHDTLNPCKHVKTSIIIITPS